MDCTERTENPIREDEASWRRHFRVQDTDLSANPGVTRQRDLGGLAASGHGVEESPREDGKTIF